MLSNIEVLEVCKEKFDYHADFFDKCIEIINNGTNVDDVNMFCDALRGMMVNGEFTSAVMTTIWAYRHRMRM